MKTDTRRHGACLCGAVRISATTKGNHVGACHCTMCRKWGGGPLLAAECSGEADIEGGENVTVYGSSEWAERGFCRRCGTHLFYRLREGVHYAIPVGLFDGDHEWVLAEQIFIDQKPACYSFAEKTRNLTGEQVFAQYSGK